MTHPADDVLYLVIAKYLDGTHHTMSKHSDKSEAWRKVALLESKTNKYGNRLFHSVYITPVSKTTGKCVIA